MQDLNNRETCQAVYVCMCMCACGGKGQGDMRIPILSAAFSYTPETALLIKQKRNR